MKDKERKLTPAELKRKEQFDVLCEALGREGYKRQDLTVGIVKANVMAFVVMLPFVILHLWLFFSANPLRDGSVSVSPAEPLLFLLMFLLATVAHEGIHGLTWGAFAGEHFRSIAFGVIWKALTPYCTCSEPLKRWQYIVGAAMPTLFLGFGLGAVSVCTGNYWLMILALCMIFGGGGDFYIILKMALHKASGGDVLYYDHPYECGVVVFERQK